MFHPPLLWFTHGTVRYQLGQYLQKGKTGIQTIRYRRLFSSAIPAKYARAALSKWVQALSLYSRAQLDGILIRERPSEKDNLAIELSWNRT